MRYALRNKDKIAAAYSPEYLKDEDAQYEDYCNAMEERVSTLEGALSQILNILED